MAQPICAPAQLQQLLRISSACRQAQQQLMVKPTAERWRL